MIFEGLNAKLEQEVLCTRTGSDGEIETYRDWQTVFDGCFLMCETRKTVPSMIRICKKGPEIVPAEISHYRTGSSVFDSRFSVFADDPTEAAGILTEEFLQNILALDALADTRFELSVHQQKLSIALSGDRRFLSMEGAETTHVSDLTANLKISLAYTSSLLDQISKNPVLF